MSRNNQPTNQPTNNLTLIDAFRTLSGRECDVLSLMLDGKSNSEIAEELYISKFTVESHISNIGKKLRMTGKQKIRKWLITQK